MTIDTPITRLALTLTICLQLVAADSLAQTSNGASLRIAALKSERIPLNTAVPEYPEDARRERLEGEATVCFSVDERGEVVRPRISSVTDRIFRKPTLSAIRASTYRPLEPGAPESPFETCRTYRYRLSSLEPLYIADDSTSAQAPAPSGTQRSGASFEGTDPLPQDTPATVAAASADPTSDPNTLITEADPLPPAEPVCKSMTRPGTRIQYTYCSTPEEQAEAEAAAANTIRSLQDESRFRDQAIDEALSRGSYPQAPALGPR